MPERLLVGAVVAVGVLHTLVPDHWMPIAVLARNSHWSTARTARTAFAAGLGHTLSTLAIGLLVWLVGLAAAIRYGHLVSILSSLALIVFGVWIAVASWRELHASPQLRGSRDFDNTQERPGSRTALLLILGSSPMVEGIPAFFAAAKFGPRLLVVMAVALSISTIAMYVVLCVYSAAALQRLALGSLERYGEALSGTIIALVGIVFLIWPFA
jgi:hypothetical protein